MTYTGTCTLPNGRTVEAISTGYWEHDTNAFVETDLQAYWTDTDDELTTDELNTDLGTHFLHEYISEFAKWN